MKKNLQITLQDAKELLKTNPFLKQSLEELFPELNSKVKDSWYDLQEVEGYYINGDSYIIKTQKLHEAEDMNKNIFVTHSQVLSSLSYSQLTQLMKDTGDCEDIDWIEGSIKYTICRESNSLIEDEVCLCYQPIAFKTESIRDEFFEKHQELLKQYFQIQ